MASERHFLAEYLIGFRTLLKWVSEPFLLFSLLAPMAGALGAGSGVGLPSLIWHDGRLDQFWAGAALLLLAMSLGVIGFLLECRAREARATFEDVVIYASRPVLLMILFLIIGWWLIGRHKPGHGLYVFLGLAALYAVGTGLGVLYQKGSFPSIRTWFERFAELFRALAERTKLPWDPHFDADHRLHALQVLLAIVMFALYHLAQALDLPAVASVGLFLVLINNIAGALKFWLGRYGSLAIVGLLGVALFFSGAHDSPPPGVTKVSLSRENPKERLLDDEGMLEKWYEQAHKRAAERHIVEPSRQTPLVVVATSGGGIRAAVWSVVVLEGLEQWIAGFPDHLRIITGASGGMVGAAHYVSARTGPGQRTATPEQVAEAASGDALSPVARAFLSFAGDRGRALEAAWERNSNERLAVHFKDLAKGENDGWRPSLVFTPTIVEDGRRLVISNLNLHGLLANPAFQIEQALCSKDPCKPCDTSVSSVQLFAGDGDAYQNLKLSSAARMSATFPWITSAVLLPSNPERRIVDAGYYDNYGVDLAVQWIRSHEAWFREKHVPVLLVQIRDGQEFEKRTKIDEDGAGFWGRGISPLSAPIEAFMATRTATMNYRNDEALEELASDFRTPELGDCGLATTVFELSAAAPLNWYLDRKARDDIRRAMPGPLDDGGSTDLTEARDRNRKMLRELSGWWSRCSPTMPRSEKPQASRL